MSYLNSVYKYLPPILQDVATSLVGFKFDRIKYTKFTYDYLKFLMESQYFDDSERKEFNVKKLEEICKYAKNNSTYYNKKFYDINFDNNISLDDIPILEKQEFRKNLDLIYTKNNEKLWTSHTSGTSGTPLKAFFTYTDFQKRMAHLLRLYSWYGLDHDFVKASFTGRLIVNENYVGERFYRYNYVRKQALFSSHHLNEDNLIKYVNSLNEIKPNLIEGIASSIFVIAKFIVDNNLRIDRPPNVVICTSETLFKDFRKIIEQAFRSKVCNLYGSQEGATIAYECPDGGFHICEESGIIECKNEIRDESKLGKLIITSFDSKATPLIRYNIGDVGALNNNVCSCGRTLKLLDRIEGRVDDMFFTEDKGVITRLDSAFKGVPSIIKKSQIIQLTLNQFLLKIVPNESKKIDEKYIKLIIKNLKKYLGPNNQINIQIVEDIPKENSGKYKMMVSKISSDLKQSKWNNTVN